jgi:hypothetical protein
VANETEPAEPVAEERLLSDPTTRELFLSVVDDLNAGIDPIGKAIALHALVVEAGLTRIEQVFKAGASSHNGSEAT